MAKTLVSGVFFNLGTAKEKVTESLWKWHSIVLILTAVAIGEYLFFLRLAFNSHSGVGVPVVLGTYLIGLIVFFIRRFQLHYVSQHRVRKIRGLMMFAGLSALVFIVASVIGVVMVPTMSDHISIALTVGGMMIAAFVILITEIYPQLEDRGSPGLITTAGLIIVFLIVYMTAVALFVVPYDPFTLNVGPLLSPPAPGYPLGTTSLGQDLFSRTIAGGAIMLQVAIISVIVCFSVGVPVGLIASYRGGKFDRIVSLIMDSIFALPGLVLAIAIAAMLSPGVVNMALAIAVVYIPSYFRVIRSQVLTVKELPYVEAAIVLGAKERDIILRYVLPNVLPSSIIVMSINFADAVLTAAGLTFVGLGLPIDVPDWGWDLTFGSQQLQVGAWWVITFPGLMIILLALGFTLVGEGLNELLTPKLQE